MEFFKPNLTMWEGQDAFVIGGGPSLFSKMPVAEFLQTIQQGALT